MSPRSRFGSKRRQFLAGAAGAGAVSVAEWLGLFQREGVPGTAKDWSIAKARAAEENDDTYLVYWFQEGGWDSYSMFSPVATANHSALSIPAGTLHPTPEWSDQVYRVGGYGGGAYGAPSVFNGIEHGYLAVDGRPLFADMCVISSALGNLFHSGGRFDFHYGIYNRSLAGYRQPDERTVMQAFAEAKGANFLIPHISWHRWLADGELAETSYPKGTGYFEEHDGPAYAHTVYGRTPRDLKARLSTNGNVATQTRRGMIRGYTDNLHARFVQGRDGTSVRSFASALDIYRQLADRSSDFDVATLFEDADLRAHFGVTPNDEITTAVSVNGNPARSKETPHVRVQAMMAYELMRAKVACALHIESRDVRQFDSHRGRNNVLDADSNSDQLAMMREHLWNPLTAFVSKLKSTEMPGVPGTSMFDRTTIVLCSEMGRTITGDVSSILSSATSDAQKYLDILAQDVCQHWHVNSVAFLGGNVNGGTQFGRVGNQTLNHIPILPSGALDGAYDPNTGVLNGTPSNQGFIVDAGHVYATALQLAGVNPTGKGRNARPALSFVQRP